MTNQTTTIHETTVYGNHCTVTMYRKTNIEEVLAFITENTENIDCINTYGIGAKMMFTIDGVGNEEGLTGNIGWADWDRFNDFVKATELNWIQEFNFFEFFRQAQC